MKILKKYIIGDWTYGIGDDDCIYYQLYKDVLGRIYDTPDEEKWKIEIRFDYIQAQMDKLQIFLNDPIVQQKLKEYTIKDIIE